MYTAAVEDYLKTIYDLQQERGQVATTTLAGRVGVAPASATLMIKKLAKLGLVVHQPYYGLKLTDTGQKIALKVLRCHRLVELFLAKTLGLSWDQIHTEAEKWEHVLSEEIAERMDTVLGFPTTNPHGSPIPAQDGTIIQPTQVRLSDLPPGRTVTIVEVCDRNPALLRYLGELGLYPGVQIRLGPAVPFTESVVVETDTASHTLGLEAARYIFVTEVTSTDLTQTGILPPEEK
jgi:DtxR family Mn-dependent transcriptional regulator